MVLYPNRATVVAALRSRTADSILVECGVDDEHGCDAQRSERIWQRTWDVQNVVVALSEQLLGQARARLADVSDYSAGRVLDVELPMPVPLLLPVPVFRVNRTDQLVVRSLEFEVAIDLVPTHGRHDASDLRAIRAGDGDLGTEDRTFTSQVKQLSSVHVNHLNSARHPLSSDGGDLTPVLVVDGVLGTQLDELALLVDDKDGLIEDRQVREPGCIGQAKIPDLLLDLLGLATCVQRGRRARRKRRRGGRDKDGGGTVRRINSLVSTRRDVLRPPGSVPVPVFVMVNWIGIPAGSDRRSDGNWRRVDRWINVLIAT